MPKPDHIAALEEKIAKALSNCSPDDLMVADLKSRMLHLKEELARVMQPFGIDVSINTYA